MKLLKIYFAGLVIFLLLASCNLRPGRSGMNLTPSTSTLTPTLTTIPSSTPIPGATRRATFVPIPSSTRGPSITPFPTSTPIPEDVLLAIQGEVTKSRFKTGQGPYQCKVVNVKPKELEILRPKEEFPGVWEIMNVGKVDWEQYDMAYFYISGTRFQTGKYKEDFIPHIVHVGYPVKLHVPMRAPAEPGVYFTIWGLRIKSLKQFFCTFSISIIVEPRQ